MKKILILLFLIFVIRINSYSTELYSMDSSSSNIIYGNLYNCLPISLVLGISANYERKLTQLISIRISAGSVMLEDEGWIGGVAMLNFHTFDDEKLCFGVGINYSYRADNNYNTKRKFIIRPALSAGFRYQPIDGGLFFNTGFNFEYLPYKENIIMYPLFFIGFGYSF